jgi:glycosyltransferase involved in cell wall biosynthesis
MYKIIIVGGPAENYIERCLNSIVNQSLTNWEAAVVLDPVGDKTYEKAVNFRSPKIKVVRNEKQMFALPNILKSIALLEPSDEDVLVTVDADDWLEGPNALATLDGYYQREPNLLVTHGSWQSYPNQGAITNNGAYSELDFKVGIRKVGFRASHLRTFKYKLWKRIKEDDLKDENGNFYPSAWDLSFMWPLIEMAGVHRVRFIPEVLYSYNQETPFNDAKVRLEEQCRLTTVQSLLPPYPLAEDI